MLISVKLCVTIILTMKYMNLINNFIIDVKFDDADVRQLI